MHRHNHESEKKLEAGLPYLLKHNIEHEEEIERWIGRAREAGREEIAGELEKVSGLLIRITACLREAVNRLEER